MIPAIMDGDIARVELLLSDNEHVDVNWQAGGKGTTALVTAADFDRAEIARLLLNSGADRNLGDAENHTPLLAAANRCNAKIVSILLDAGANPDIAESRYGFTPLLEAVRNGCTETVKVLLSADADRDIAARNGFNPVGLAMRSGNQAMIDLLVRNQDDTPISRTP